MSREWILVTLLAVASACLVDNGDWRGWLFFGAVVVGMWWLRTDQSDETGDSQ